MRPPLPAEAPLSSDLPRAPVKAPPAAPSTLLSRAVAVQVFLVLALAYFLSALLRSVTGTLAPLLTKEFSLSAGQLGLLAGAYFLGFAAMQLPLGRWLDRHGPRRVLLALLGVAAASAVAFALAQGFGMLLLSRLLGGVGVCACLMAPLTGFRRWLAPEVQQRANAWMLMTGALGMLSSTLPVQFLLPLIGWRGVFLVLAGLFVLAMAGIAWRVPGAPSASTGHAPAGPDVEGASMSLLQSYRPIFANAFFRRCAPLALVNFSALMAVQTLWAGPWLTTVAGCTPQQAAQGLFGINLTMLVTYWCWGLWTPRLVRIGWGATRMLVAFAPAGALCLLAIAALGPAAGWPALALFCLCSSVLSLAQPAVGMAFPVQESGRALSAFNLLMFLGTFVLQWTIGLGIDALQGLGLARIEAFRVSFALLAAASLVAYGYFLVAGRRMADTP